MVTRAMFLRVARMFNSALRSMNAVVLRPNRMQNLSFSDIRLSTNSMRCFGFRVNDYVTCVSLSMKNAMLDVKARVMVLIVGPCSMNSFIMARTVLLSMVD